MGEDIASQASMQDKGLMILSGMGVFAIYSGIYGNRSHC